MTKDKPLLEKGLSFQDIVEWLENSEEHYDKDTQLEILFHKTDVVSAVRELKELRCRCKEIEKYLKSKPDDEVEKFRLQGFLPCNHCQAIKKVFGEVD